MHPAIAPMIERAAYVGGCDGVAGVKSAELIGALPVGTMAHAAILILGEERAWRAFDKVTDPDVPRVALIDTFSDEKFGAVAAAEVLGGRLAAVRLDTPGSRRGNFGAILREVRWELDARGFGDVKLFASGGLDESRIRELNPFADAYGVGTWISGGPVVDFSLDIVEVEGERRAKRGKLSGRKQLWGCGRCGERGLALREAPRTQCPSCHGEVHDLTQRWLESGRPARELPSAADVRALAIVQADAAQDPFA
jgi:nicotinate phosphoribosyltransferase